MSQATLSRRLSGSSPFRVDELAAIASLLGVRVSSFFAQPPRRANGVARPAAPASVSARIPARAPRPAHRGPTTPAVPAVPNRNRNPTMTPAALGRRSA